MATEPFPGPVVRQGWLRSRPAQAVRIADVRWVPGGSALDAFAAGHVRGAVLLDVDADLAAPPFEGPGRHPLPAPGAFAAAMGRVGIADDTPVVVYDDVRGSVAARLWWMLDAIGHPVALLDGGLGAWDGPIETGPGRRPRPAPFTPRPWPKGRVVDAVAVAKAIRSGEGSVVDVRVEERYRGEVEPIDPVPGHIPGARNLPWTQNLDPATGLFLPAEEIRARYAAIGIADAAEAIAQCGSGVSACHAILAMRLGGMGDAQLYEGSWSDWVSDPSRPVSTGPEAGG